MITQNGHVIQTSLVSDFGDLQAGRIVWYLLWHWVPLLRLLVMQHQGSLHFSLVWVVFNAGTFSCTWCSSWLKNMLTHTYPHKPIRKMTMAIGNHQTDCSVNMKHDVWIGDFPNRKKRHGHAWLRKSLLRLHVINNTKLYSFTFMFCF